MKTFLHAGVLLSRFHYFASLFPYFASLFRRFAELFDRKMPDLPPEEDTSLHAEISIPSLSRDGQNTGPFEDEDSKSFYTDLPDLRVLVPAVLLGISDGDKKEEGTEVRLALSQHVVHFCFCSLFLCAHVIHIHINIEP